MDLLTNLTKPSKVRIHFGLLPPSTPLGNRLVAKEEVRKAVDEVYRALNYYAYNEDYAIATS